MTHHCTHTAGICDRLVCDKELTEHERRLEVRRVTEHDDMVSKAARRQVVPSTFDAHEPKGAGSFPHARSCPACRRDGLCCQCGRHVARMTRCTNGRCPECCRTHCRHQTTAGNESFADAHWRRSARLTAAQNIGPEEYNAELARQEAEVRQPTDVS